MRNLWFVPLLSLFCTLTAQVSMKIERESAVLENEWLRVEFSNPGGKMTVFYDKQGKTDLTWNKQGENSSGACKDQIPVMDFSFRDSNYSFEQVRNTPEECTFRVTSANSKLEWKFQEIQREYTLRKGEKILICKLRISNKKENMAPITMQYWMHSNFGVKNEDSLFQFADTEDIKRFVPSNKSNGKMFVEPARNWIGMIGKSGRGIIVMPEYKRLGVIYPWYCKEYAPLDTLEFRLIPESIPEDSSLETVIFFAAAANLPEISGAGEDAQGFLTVEKNIVKGKISGFRNCSGTLILTADGKKLSEQKINIKTGNVSVFSFKNTKIPSNAAVVTVEFHRNGKKSFDLLWGKGPFPTEKRNAPAGNKEPWQYEFKDTAELPFFQWTAKEKPNVLALIPLNGVQDVFELKHRRPMDVTIPVIFPANYSMSWRISCTVPNVADKTGCNQVKNFLSGKKYDTFLIGSHVFAPWDARKDVWTSLPAATRKDILSRVYNGSGLLIINPEKEDPEIKKILSSGKDITKELCAKMDFSAAPYFSNTKIRESGYGKGKIILVDYPAHGWLVPREGTRVINFQKLKLDHRFQEYQFAILANLVDRVNGKKTVITKFSAQGDTVTIYLSRNAAVTFTAFDSYTNEIGKITKQLPEGTSSFNLKGLFHGTNYIHATADSGDFAYTVTEIRRSPRIRRITLDKTKGIRANLKISNATKNTTAEYEIRDVDDRILKRGTGTEFYWDTANTVSNFHKIIVTLKENGTPVGRKVREFHLPEKMDSSSHFGNLLWNSGDNLPEYIYPEYWKKFREFGFTFLYNASSVDASYAKLLRYSPLECGLNWLSNGPFHTNEGIDQWAKTHNKKHLARKNCPSNPQRFNRKECGISGIRLMEDFTTRKIFQLGDEMSISYYNSPFDNCICTYCMKQFRAWLKERHGSLDKLNSCWKTKFEKWDDVMPMTRIEVLSHPVPAPWVEHRLFMDKVFLDAMLQCKANIQAVYPGAFVGPTGVNHPPHVYGGNWNFRNMSQLDCVSIYGPVRLTASFNRNKRLIMSYFGYSNNEAGTWYDVWESLFQGARSTNNWYGHVFVLPNMELAEIRNFYKDLMWLLRSGPGDLLYHSQKITDQVGILHSQNSLISNFLKTRKTDYWQKEKSFAQAMEDLGLPYRFIAPDELDKVNMKAIILPEASALSDKEIDILCKFVLNGGILIADYEAGTQTELCESRAERKLDRLFGIKTGRFRLVTPDQIKNTAGIEMEKVGSGVSLNGGKADCIVKAGSKNVPVLIRKKTGKGMTFLLNFSHKYSEQRGLPEGQAFLKMLSSLLPFSKPAFLQTEKNPVMHNIYRNGNTIYAALLPAPPSGWKNMSLEQLRKRTFTGILTFENKGYLYEAIEGKYIGSGSRFNITMSAGIPKLFAFFPYQPVFHMTSPGKAKQGEIVKLNMSVQNGKHHVFILRVIDPSGKEMYQLRKVKETLNGTAEFEIPFALNDPAGTWKIIGKDGATGQTKTISLELETK